MAFFIIVVCRLLNVSLLSVDSGRDAILNRKITDAAMPGFAAFDSDITPTYHFRRSNREDVSRKLVLAYRLRANYAFVQQALPGRHHGGETM